MKKFLFFLTIVFVFVQNNSLLAQQPDAPVFGTDIVVKNLPEQNQQNLVVCSAFNGWWYAAYSYDTQGQGSKSVLKSEDKGATWTVLFEGPCGIDHSSYTKLDILVCGTSLSDLTLFLACCRYDSVSGRRLAWITTYNGVTGEPIDEIFQDPSYKTKDLAIASDYLYPAANSNPYSIVAVYSKGFFTNPDSIYFCSFSNGGVTFYLSNKKRIASSPNYFHKVALSYGRSPSYPEGRYFATWEEQTAEGAEYGHIYTAHTETDINSSFTEPVMLDSLDPSLYNKVRNPSIACQSNDVDNSHQNITEIVLFEKNEGVANQNKVVGFYNTEAASADNFHKVNIDTMPGNKLQPDICFNPYDTGFMVTYYDSTANKLPFITNNFNLTEPDSWNIISAGYNDTPDLSHPQPGIALDLMKQSGMTSWIAERPGGNGEAFMDAPFIYYAGVQDEQTSTSPGCRAFPNPASTEITFEFELPAPGTITLSIHSTLGQPAGASVHKGCSAGKQQLRYDVSQLPAGLYFYTLRTNTGVTSGKVVVSR